jgi:hypothetical protein
MIGSAILKEVASIAAASVTMHIAPNAKRNPLEGWKIGFTSSIGVVFGDSEVGGRVPFLGECGNVADIFSSMDEVEEPDMIAVLGIDFENIICMR